MQKLTVSGCAVKCTLMCGVWKKPQKQLAYKILSSYKVDWTSSKTWICNRLTGQPLLLAGSDGKKKKKPFLSFDILILCTWGHSFWKNSSCTSFQIHNGCCLNQFSSYQNLGSDTFVTGINEKRGTAFPRAQVDSGQPHAHGQCYWSESGGSQAFLYENGAELIDFTLRTPFFFLFVSLYCKTDVSRDATGQMGDVEQLSQQENPYLEQVMENGYIRFRALNITFGAVEYKKTCKQCNVRADSHKASCM